MDYLHHYASPLGDITLSSDGTSLTGLWFDGQTHFGSTLTGAGEERPLPVFRQSEEWLDRYFRGLEPGPLPPLSPAGTPFRRRVWSALLTIPYGETRTYGKLARQLGLPPGGARAVGGAVGRNPISLMIPCHRVVGGNGSLTGYAGGLEKKAALLTLEGHTVSDGHLR